MPIHYDGFDFACPPRVGTRWFLHACQLAGLGPGFQEQAHAEFNGNRQLKVSLVRDPRHWLQSAYASILQNDQDAIRLGGFYMLTRISFNDWLDEYLDDPHLSVMGLFDQYRADTVMRIEDMPWAFVEFMESIGIEKTYRETIMRLQRLNRSKSLPAWNQLRWDEVMHKERILLERYEYA